MVNSQFLMSRKKNMTTQTKKHDKKTRGDTSSRLWLKAAPSDKVSRFGRSRCLKGSLKSSLKVRDWRVAGKVIDKWWLEENLGSK